VNLTDLIQRTRDVVADQATDSQSARMWSDSEVVRALNGASDAMWRRAVLADESWGLDFVTLTDLSATSVEVAGFWNQVTIPGGLPGYIKQIEEGVTTADSGQEIEFTNLGGAGYHKQDYVWKYDNNRAWSWGPSETLMFTTNGNTFDLDEVRIWYVRKPPHFARFTLTTSAQHPTTSTLFFDPRSAVVVLGDMSTLNRYYQNCWLHCTASDETAGEPAGNRFRVTGWVAGAYPNHTMTVSPAHNVAGVQTTTWEIGFAWPEEHTDLIAFLAARKLLMKGGDAAQIQVIQAEIASLMEDYILTIENRQIQTMRSVNWQERI